MLDQLYRQLVMDHAKYRRNHEELKGNDIQYLYYKNPTCGDIMTLYWNFSQEGILCDVAFVGDGCAISMASCSMMTELIKGKTAEEIKIQKQGMEDLIRKGRPPEYVDLGDALSLEGVHRLKARHNCALMGWQALDKALKI